MSLKPEVILTCADGDYLFRLNGREIEELQKLCGNIGFAAIYQRVALGVWFWGDLYHTVRLGLEGGGMGPVEARRKTDMYIGREKAAIALSGPNKPEAIALAILNAAMHGWEDLPTGEAEAPKS